MNDDGMRLRVRAMLKFMDIHETPQPNKGRIHIDKAALIEVVKKNGGKILFDLEGYTRFKEEETTANKFPDVVQQVRPRFRPARPGQGPPGTFIRDGDPVPPYKSHEERRDSMRSSMRQPNDNEYPDYQEGRRTSSSRSNREDRASQRGFAPVRPLEGDRMHDRPESNYVRTNESWHQDQRYGDEHRGGPRDSPRRSSFHDQEEHGRRGYRSDRPDFIADRRGSQREFSDSRPGGGHENGRRDERYQEPYERRNWEGRRNMHSDNGYDPNLREVNIVDRGRVDDRSPRLSMNRNYSDDQRNTLDNRSSARFPRRPGSQEGRFSDFSDDRGGQHGTNNVPTGFRATRNDHGFQASNYEKQQPSHYNNGDPGSSAGGVAKKRSYDDYQKQPTQSRGYDIEPAYAKRRSLS